MFISFVFPRFVVIEMTIFWGKWFAYAIFRNQWGLLGFPYLKWDLKGYLSLSANIAKIEIFVQYSDLESGSIRAAVTPQPYYGRRFRELRMRKLGMVPLIPIAYSRHLVWEISQLPRETG